MKPRLFAFALFGTLALASSLTATAAAGAARWGTADEDTVKYMLACEEKWAKSACGPQPDLTHFIAEDFQGTSTTGSRYGKQEAISSDGQYHSRDCHLGEVKVRFFGDDVAVAYGAENRIDRAADGKESKRCQVWTDTWLKRAGKWEIVAAQDTIIPCAP